MNQTKKRLQIINIAISITDIETIQLQMLKLSSLKTDVKLKEIMAGLQAQNYAQTQSLITEYIETPTEEIVQRTSQNDEEVIEEFDLFLTTPESSSEEEEDPLELERFITEHNAKKEAPADFDNLLKLTADDIMPDNIDLTLSAAEEDDFFALDASKEDRDANEKVKTDIVPKDDFFDLPETGDSVSLKKEKPPFEAGWDGLLHTVHKEEEPPFEVHREPKPVSDSQPLSEAEKAEKRVQIPESNNTPREKEQKEPSSPSVESTTLNYPKIPYIDQKFKNMLTQYPPLHPAQKEYLSVTNLLIKISNEGYSEKEVEELIVYIGKLKEKDEPEEAAQLLLICGATQSKYAQFMLARELFKGNLLEKNLAEAFTLINRLAMDDDYPEAICDLAQLYENGIGIGKDRNRAEILYQTAMDLGIKRAATHYARHQHTKKGLLGKLFGKKGI
jgi:hypothetical protein